VHDDGNDGSKPSHTRLFELASEQGGFFTAVHARACGFSKALLAHHAKSASSESTKDSTDFPNKGAGIRFETT
jgi:hypothetical protein